MTARTHPLFGELLEAQSFKRLDGVVHLVVDLPDGSPGTIRVDATDVMGVVVAEAAGTVLTAEGVQVLRRLMLAVGATGTSKPSRVRVTGGRNA